MEDSKTLQMIEEINENKKLLEEINNAKSAEDISKAMAAAGYPVTPENAQIAFAQLQSGVELGEGDLDTVSGGVFLETALVYSLAAYVACLGAGIGGAIYSAATSKKKKR